jgi:hypothetical protein
MSPNQETKPQFIDPEFERISRSITHHSVARVIDQTALSMLKANYESQKK